MSRAVLGPPVFSTSDDGVDDLDALLPEANSLRRAGAVSKRAVIAGARALGSAPRGGVGLYVAQQHGPMDESAAFVASSWRGSPRLVSPAVFTEAVENIAATHLSLTLGLTGTVETFTGTRAAALQAVAAAAEDLGNGATREGLVVVLGLVTETTVAAYRAVLRGRGRMVPYVGAAAFTVRRDGPGAALVAARVSCRGPRGRKAAVADVTAGLEAGRLAFSACSLDPTAPADSEPEAFALDPVRRLSGISGEGRSAVIVLGEDGVVGTLAVEGAWR